MTFKYFNSLSPAFIKDVFKPSGQKSVTTSALSLKLDQPMQKTNHRQINLLYMAPNIKNKL